MAQEGSLVTNVGAVARSGAHDQNVIPPLSVPVVYLEVRALLNIHDSSSERPEFSQRLAYVLFHDA